MYLVLMVIDDPAKVDNVLDQLKIGGIAGATIVESTGLHRKRKRGSLCGTVMGVLNMKRQIT